MAGLLNDIQRQGLRAGMALLCLCASTVPSPAQTVPIPHSSDSGGGARTNIQGVVADSFRLLVLEHTTRIVAQGKTRRELGGPFWSDYRQSVRIPNQWSDGDGWLVNYIGHPGHGAAAGFIWARHDPGSPSRDSGFGGSYWRGRLRSTAWMTAYSLQFELGPFSEASIGNVGRNPRTTGWVDHVVTPVGGLGVMFAEDAVDRFVIATLEGRVRNRIVRGVLRTALNPSRALANTASGRSPWHRDALDRNLGP